MPYVDERQGLRFVELAEGEDPDRRAASLATDPAVLAVGPPTAYRRAGRDWFAAYETARRTHPAPDPEPGRTGPAAPSAAVDPTPAAAASEAEPAPTPVADTAPVPAIPTAPAPSDPAEPVRFRPRGQQDLAPPGVTAKARANLAALDVLTQLRAENRPATGAEQAVLGRWSAWGALPDMFADRSQLAALDDTAWRAARATTPNAHYTDAALVQAGWDLLTHLGFTGGRVLEPGCGSGNWIGLAPDGLPVQMVGVELDPTTAAIARVLYPDTEIHKTEIHNEGFEASTFPLGSFDAVVGNVPFGNYPAFDPVHNPDNKLAIHNMFLVKSLRLVKPGGIVVAITSTWTMDARNPAARRAMQAEADLLGAIRLPSGAHQAAAGTGVPTDLLVFRRRRDGETPAPFTWERATAVALPDLDTGRIPDGVERDPDGRPLARVNQFFADHPGAVLGRLALGGARSATDLRVVADPDRWQEDFAAQADDLVERARRSHGADGPVAWPGQPEPVEPAAGQDGPILPAEAGSLAVDGDGNLVRQRPDGSGKPVATASQAEERELRALVGLLEDVRRVLAAQGDSSGGEAVWRATQTRLDNHYDAYVAAYGRLSDTTTVADGVDPDTGKPVTGRRPRVPRPILTDPGWAMLSALEVVHPTTGAVTKAAIFTERVISPHRTPTGVDTAGEALAASLTVHGDVRLPYIADLLGVDTATAERELGDLAFRNPATGELEAAAMYLSGNVRAKLSQAREAVARDGDRWTRNVAALEAVQPEDLTPIDIDVKLGASWIPPEDVRDFVARILGVFPGKVVVEHSPKTASWTLKAPSTIPGSTDWGTDRCDARRLIDHALNHSETKIVDLVKQGDKEVRVPNSRETAAAQDKRQLIEKEFSEWIWSDPDRATRLARVYNDLFHNTHLADFDGSHLTFPGMATTFTPRPHQRDAAWRIVSGGIPGTGGNTLLGHVVGAGKTATMVMAGMEMLRLGLVNKPLFVVPNSMLEQFGRDVVQLYPLAKVLIASVDDFKAGARQAFAARCMMGNWDAVVMTHSSFGRLPVSPTVEKAYLDSEIAEFTSAVEAARADGDRQSFSVKEMEKRLKRFQARQSELQESLRAGQDTDAAVYFDHLGVDFIFFDEAHVLRGLPTASRLPTGISVSSRARGACMKLDHLRATHGDQITCFATGTPIANSLAELWVLHRYLSPQVLDEAGVREFDAWAATFVRAVTALEMAPEGGRLRMKTRIASFANVPEMITMFRRFADIKSAADLDLPRPQLSGGERTVALVPPSPELEEYIAELGKRADQVRDKKVDPDDDNMLLISMDGRKASLDTRMVGLPAPSNGGKVQAAANRILARWKETRATRYLNDPDNSAAGYHPRPGALLVAMCDLGTPQPKNTNAAAINDGFVFYDALRDLLVADGIPPGEIAYAHQATTDAAVAKQTARLRNGEISVFIGSTEKAGVGRNYQNRLHTLFHLDVPWRPMDMEQREGRILRQGNQNPVVSIEWILGEGSFDSFMAQTVERKARFIAQVPYLPR